MRFFAVAIRAYLMNGFTNKLKLYLKLRNRRWAYRFMPVPHPDKWVFISGCYNSGTTLLHELLSHHPEIGAMPNEGQFFTDQLMTGAKAGVRRLWGLKPELFRMTDTSTGVDVQKLKKEWSLFFNDRRKRILIEKTIANSARTRWLQKEFQPAYFICLFRNGYAVSEGIHRKEKHDFNVAAEQWRVSNEILIEDIIHLKNVIRISYEDLSEDPQQTLKKVTDFIGISELNKDLFSSSFSIHKMNSQIKNMNEESFKRLKKEDIDSFNKIAGSTMQKLGYPLL
jgi:hypothetical protein